MTPVGFIIVILGLAAAFQLAAHGPGFLAGGIAVLIAIVLCSLTVRAANELIAMHGNPRPDPWARSTRSEQEAMARSLRLTMSMAALTSLYPEQALRGVGLAHHLKLA